VFSIGYADSVTDPTVNTTGNSIELMYTIAADANLDGQVSLTDLGVLTGNFGAGTRWTQADFNYDSQVSLADFGILTSTFGQSLLTAGGPAVAPASASASLTPAVTATTPSTITPSTTPAVDSAGRAGNSQSAASVQAAASTKNATSPNALPTSTSDVNSDSTDGLTGRRAHKNKKREHKM
jgi:hypothetical protein